MNRYSAKARGRRTILENLPGRRLDASRRRRRWRLWCGRKATPVEEPTSGIPTLTTLVRVAVALGVAICDLFAPIQR